MDILAIVRPCFSSHRLLQAMALALLALLVLPSSLLAADLYRFRMLAIPDIHPGCTTEIQVVVDHTRWPFPGTPLDPNKRLRAFSFGLTLPAPLQYVSHTFNGTHLQQMIQGNPWFASVRPVTGGVTVGVVMDSLMQKSMPEGTSQIVIKIRVRVPLATPSQQLTLNFTGGLASPAVALEFVMPAGAVVPAWQPRTLNVTPGTCMLPARCGVAEGLCASTDYRSAFAGTLYYPAIAAGTGAPPMLPLFRAPQEAQAPIEVAGDPFGESMDPSEEEDSSEPPPDASTLEFPEPTEEELEVQWTAEYGASTDASPGGDESAAVFGPIENATEAATVESGSSALGPDGPPCGFCLLCKNCNIACGAVPAPSFLVDSTLPDDPEASPPRYDTIQEAINEADISGLIDPVIKVVGGTVAAPRTYAEGIVIDLSAFEGQGTLVLYSDAGPEATIIKLPAGAFGPVVNIFGDGDLTDDGDLVLGWTTQDISQIVPPENPDKTGWQGFTIRDGVGGLAFEPGGGIRIDDVEATLHVRGNIIKDNPGTGTLLTGQGGGIGIFNADQVVVVLNVIEKNRSLRNGAGVFVDKADVWLTKNVIRENTFEPTGADLGCPGAGTVRSCRGGGVCITNLTDVCDEDGTDGSVSAYLCRNRIYGNKAKQGGGVYFGIGEDPTAVPDLEGFLHMELNYVYNNTAFELTTPSASLHPYQGGGVCIQALLDGTTGDFDALELVNNQIFDNDITIANAASAYSGTEPNEVGGGLFLDVDNGSLSGGAADGGILFGNGFSNNNAKSAGGGVYLGVYQFGTGLDPMRLHQNTINGNNLADETAGRGSGIYFPYRTGPAPDFSDVFAFFEGNGNVLWHNFSNATVNEWHVAPDTTVPMIAPPSGPWVYSYLPDQTPTTVGGTEDIYGDDALTNNVNNTPGLSDTHRPHLAPGAAAAASATDAGLSLFDQFDIDFEPRPLDAARDRGADQLFTRFKRGDADGNGIFGPLLDPLHILNYQFAGGPPPPCFDAADADDNGDFVALVDAFFLLNFGFNGGAAPPSPGHLDCGGDGTSDDVDCITSTPSCP